MAESVAALDAQPVDAGLVRLVERYAAAIDEAGRIAEDAAKVRPEGVDGARALAALRQRVEHQVVLAELGPKLLAALAELGASPKARASLRGRGGGAAGDGAPGQSKLDELRVRRTARQG